MKYYAVKKGRNPGIYTIWEECRNQVEGFPGARYKGFPNKELAQAFLEGKDPKGYPIRGIACDGGSKGNPGTMLIKVHDLSNHSTIRVKNCGQGTNNQAEIHAILQACYEAGYDTEIYSDSNTAILWATGYGNPTVNKSMINKIQQLMSEKNLVIKKWDKNKWGEIPADLKKIRP